MVPAACAAPDTIAVETAVVLVLVSNAVPVPLVVEVEVSALPVNRITGLSMFGVGVELLAVLPLILPAEGPGVPSSAPELVKDKLIDCKSSVDDFPVALIAGCMDKVSTVCA